MERAAQLGVEDIYGTPQDRADQYGAEARAGLLRDRSRPAGRAALLGRQYRRPQAGAWRRSTPRSPMSNRHWRPRQMSRRLRRTPRRVSPRAEVTPTAIKVEAEAIRTNPEIVKMRAVEKWNGELPTYVGGNGPMPFVDVEMKPAGRGLTRPGRCPGASQGVVKPRPCYMPASYENRGCKYGKAPSPLPERRSMTPRSACMRRLPPVPMTSAIARNAIISRCASPAIGTKRPSIASRKTYLAAVAQLRVHGEISHSLVDASRLWPAASRYCRPFPLALIEATKP